MTSDLTSPTLAQVISVLEEFFPSSTAASWDRVGLVTGDPEQPVRRIHAAVDPTLEVIAQARDAGADLLITHHPLLLRGVHSVATTSAKGAAITSLVVGDVALYVGKGQVDAGITGRDLLLDSGSTATEVMGLGFGGSTFRFAGRPGEASGAADLGGRRVATSYAGLVRDHLAAQGITADVVRLDGAVETAITLGVADAIADVVETGTTLRQQGLEVFGEPILRSEAVLIRRPESSQGRGIDVLHRRLTGVVTAREYVMLDYDVPEDALDRVIELTPGLESPTISPLSRTGWYAVRAMVGRGLVQSLMDDLWDAGARAIISTELSACRL